MNKLSRKSVLLLAALITAAQLANAADSTNNSGASGLSNPLNLFSDDVVAKGSDVKVTRPMLDEALINIKASAAARGQVIPPEHMKALEAQVLNRLIGMQLLNSKATEAEKKAGAEQAQTRLETIKKNAGSEESFVRQLKTVGMTTNELTKKLADEATAETVLERELKVAVTSQAVTNFYEENPSQFEQPEMVRAAHILISTREKDGSEMTPEKKKEKLKLAQDLDKRAKDGADFAKLAKEYSEDPGSKDNGGEYKFPRGQMVPEFEAAAFSMDTNQVSDIVTTQFGYHIIKTLEKFPAKKVELADAADNIQEFLKTREMQKQLPDYMAKIEKQADVQILDPDLKQIIEEQRAANEEMQKTNAAAADAPKADTQK